MKKLTLTIAAASIAAMTITGCAGAQKKADDKAASAAPAGGPAAAKLPASAVCPVAKETFKPTAATKTATYKGKTYYFCCPGCDKKFAANPEKYLAAGPAAAATPGSKKPCSGDCTDECGDCANPNKKAATATGVKMMTGAELGSALPATAKCSVSGREFKPTAETQLAEYKGKKHYFCCGGCAKKFAAAPDKFATN